MSTSTGARPKVIVVRTKADIDRAMRALKNGEGIGLVFPISEFDPKEVSDRLYEALIKERSKPKPKKVKFSTIVSPWAPNQAKRTYVDIKVAGVVVGEIVGHRSQFGMKWTVRYKGTVYSSPSLRDARKLAKRILGGAA